MFGTVAELRLKPGMEQRMMELQREFDNRHVPGFVAEYVYRLDSNPNSYMLAVVFQDRESYLANANDPKQDEFYHRMVELLDGEPVWHDGEIVHTGPKAAP